MLALIFSAFAASTPPVFHRAGMRLQRQALDARDDVEMQVVDGLAGGGSLNCMTVTPSASKASLAAAATFCTTGSRRDSVWGAASRMLRDGGSRG